MALWPIPAMRSVSSEYRIKMHETSDNRGGNLKKRHYPPFVLQLPAINDVPCRQGGGESIIWL